MLQPCAMIFGETDNSHCDQGQSCAKRKPLTSPNAALIVTPPGRFTMPLTNWSVFHAELFPYCGYLGMVLPRCGGVSALVRARRLNLFVGERSEVGLRTAPYENSTANSESLHYWQRQRSTFFEKGCKSICPYGQEMFLQAVLNGLCYAIRFGNSAWHRSN